MPRQRVFSGPGSTNPTSFHFDDRPAADLAFSFADDLTRQILARFVGEKLKADEFAWTLIDLQNPVVPAIAGYRADEPIYPASVVKLFYLAAAQHQLESGQMPDTPELRRALRDMIVDSSNDATALVLDMLTGTTGGRNFRPQSSRSGRKNATASTAFSPVWASAALMSIKNRGTKAPMAANASLSAPITTTATNSRRRPRLVCFLKSRGASGFHPRAPTRCANF